MFSVLHQEKTALRDARGGTVFRRLYLCDAEADIPAIPASDAPGSMAVIADGGACWLLDHAGAWHRADGLCFLAGGGVWSR